MKTRTQVLTNYAGSRAQRQSVRRYGYALLTFVCGLILAGCVAPESALNQSEHRARVGAIQTRVVETRAEQASAVAEAQASRLRSQGMDAETDARDGAAAAGDSAMSDGPTAEQQALLAKLRPQGEAPELFNEVWLNSAPLTLADLRGKVVLVEFWTYG